MSSILRLDSSSRGSDSHSKSIADLIEETLLSQQAGSLVQRRDLSRMEIPFISEETISGFYSSKENLTPELRKATELSDQLIAELQSAEILIISAPMYNFSIPSCLKAWIDQIVRINETFGFDGERFHGLVGVKRAVLALSYGATGYTESGGLTAMNFFEPYLLSLMSFLGIEETQVFRIEGTSILEASELASIKSALHDEIIASLGSK